MPPNRRSVPPSAEPPREAPRAARPPEEPSQREPPVANYKAVYTIIERGQGRAYWLRIGVAFVNRDGSFNVRLDALPVNGQLHIRDPKPEEDEG